LGVGNVGATVDKCPLIQRGILLEDPLCNYSPMLLMESQKNPFVETLIGITYFTASSEPLLYKLIIIRIGSVQAQDATYYKTVGGLKALKLPSYMTMAKANTQFNFNLGARSSIAVLPRSMI